MSTSRYDSERQLFAGVDDSEGFNPDDPNASWNPERDTRSYFADLLDHEDLLERFVIGEAGQIIAAAEQQEPRQCRHQRSRIHISKDYDNDNEQEELEFDPEDAFLRINAKLRNAIKKHTPWVITNTFKSQVLGTRISAQPRY